MSTTATPAQLLAGVAQEHSEIVPLGLVLLATNTPDGTLQRSIQDVEFDQIGFFYWSKTNARDSGYKVVLKSILGTEDCHPFDLSDDVKTLDWYYHHPLITKMNLYPLKPQGNYSYRQLAELCTKLALSIAKHQTLSVKTDTVELIYQLFGHPITHPDAESVSAVEFVNRIIADIDMEHAVPDVCEPPSLQCADDKCHPIHGGSKSLNSLAQLVGKLFKAQQYSHANTANRFIASYIGGNSCLFSQCIEVSLPCRDEARVQRELEQYNMAHADSFQKMASTFVRLIAGDVKFSNTVMNGVRQRRATDSLFHKLAGKAVNSMYAAMVDVASVINSATSQGTLSFSQLQQALTEFNTAYHQWGLITCQEVVDVNLSQPTVEQIVVAVPSVSADRVETLEVPTPPASEPSRPEDDDNIVDQLLSGDFKVGDLNSSQLERVSTKLRAMTASIDDPDTINAITQLITVVAQQMSQ